MFTSRAEHRLLLRIDNADLRLTPRGREAGLVSDERWARFEARRARLDANLARVRSTAVATDTGERVPASMLLKQPPARLQPLLDSGVLALDIAPSERAVDVASVETEVKYEGYILRQRREVERTRRDERRRIPEGFPFERVPGLSREALQRLAEVRPETLGQASRIPGVTPAAVAVLAACVARSHGESTLLA